MLNGGADPNVRVYDDLTPLTIAAARGLTEIVKTLLSHGADVTLKAAFGLTVYDVATGEAVIELLKKAQGSRKRLPPPPGTTALSVSKLMCDAAEKGNAGLVRVLIREEGKRTLTFGTQCN